MQELVGNNVEGVLALRNPWPSIARTVFQDHERYLTTYMKPYPGVFYTGDGAARDEHGYIWIKGRVDGERRLACFLALPFTRTSQMSSMSLVTACRRRKSNPLSFCTLALRRQP